VTIYVHKNNQVIGQPRSEGFEKVCRFSVPS
jgi:hypothetical protein